jgi:hypothetical protein
MKNVLRILALVALIGGLAIWLATGAKAGWTQTIVQVKTLDPVTGIEGIDYQSRFVAGLDFLVAAFVGSGILAAASLFFRKQPNPT